MSELNNKLLKAGISDLIKTDKNAFIDRITLYLQKFPELVDFFFEGPLPINEEVKATMENKIKSIIPSPEYFHGITDIKIEFDYCQRQVYRVEYKVDMFYSSENAEDYGKTVPDENHPYAKLSGTSVTIYPNDIKQ